MCTMYFKNWSLVLVISNIIGLARLQNILVENNTIILYNYQKPNDCQDLQFRLSNGISHISSTNKFISDPTRLIFPKDIFILEYQWFEVWCAKLNKTLSSILLDPESFNIQINPFKQSYVQSGPILILDDQTFLVTNFHYKNEPKNSKFWVGNYSNGPTIKTCFIQMEKSEYKGEDVYVVLPNNLTIYDISYFGVYGNISYLTYVEVPRLKSRLPHFNGNQRNTTMYIPKCCPKGHTKLKNKCIPIQKMVEINYINVYNDNYLMENVTVSRYKYSPRCKEMFALERDEASLQLSGFLYIYGSEEVEMISKEEYCIDYIKSDDEFEEVVLVCYRNTQSTDIFNFLEKFCVIGSIICLFITFLIFTFLKPARILRGIIIIGFTGSMLLRYVLLLLAFVELSDKACYIVALFYNYVYNSTFVWLLFLIYDSNYRIRSSNARIHPQNSYKSVLICLGIPALVSLLNINSPGYISKNLEISIDFCGIKENHVLFINFYFIILLLFITSILTIITWNLTKKIEKNYQRDARGVRKVLLSSIFVMITMYMSYTAEVFAIVTGEQRPLAYILLDVLQGVYLFIIYVLHNPVYEVVKNWIQGRNQLY